MRRICPRRSGLEWQERQWNRIHREKQMMSDASRLVHPDAVCQEHSMNGHSLRIAKPPEQLRMHRTMHRNYRVAEYSGAGVFLERLEPCEGKLSRTVLRGAWTG